MSDITAEAIREIAALATDGAETRVLLPGHLYWRPKAGGGGEVLDLRVYEDLTAAGPQRARGTVVCKETSSLLGYIARHKNAEQTVLYADRAKGTVTAIFDDDAPAGGAAGWRAHRGVLQLAFTPEWQLWAGHDSGGGRPLMDQTEFAELLEQGMSDVMEPDGAELLELVQHFEATRTATVKQVKLIGNGQRQLLYAEEIDARGGAGRGVIPGEFILVLAPFEGSDPERVTARLRYRLSGDGKLTIGYVLLRPQAVLRNAFVAVLAEIEQATGLTPLLAVAPEPASGR